MYIKEIFDELYKIMSFIKKYDKGDFIQKIFIIFEN